MSAVPERSEKQLPGALRRHLSNSRLKVAFDAVGNLPGFRRYDRTTLTRWLAGGTPQNRDFIERLSQELGDPAVLAAYDADADRRPVEMRDLLSRFRRFSHDDQRSLHLAMSALLHSETIQTRRDFNMTIGIGPATGVDSFRRLDVRLEWSGYLPAAACVVIASDEVDLDLAYGHAGCIFRELVPLKPAQFRAAAQAMGAGDPELRWRSGRSGRRTLAALSSRPDDTDGSYMFDNPEIADADIRLDVCLPYPSDLPIYPVVLNSGPIRGAARVTLVTDPILGRPHVLHFLGQTDAWTELRASSGDELVVEIGDGDSIITPNAGLVFYWRDESSSASPAQV